MMQLRRLTWCGILIHLLTVDAAAQAHFPSFPFAAIPNLNPLGVVDSVYVGGGGVLTDIDIEFRLTHTWTGDLVITVIHPTGASVTLMDRPGVPKSPFGCSGDDPHIFADDEGQDGAIETDCQSGTGIAYTTGGRYVPAGSLALFDSLPLDGYWSLRVADVAGGADIGIFESWAVWAEGIVTPDVEQLPPSMEPSLEVRPNPAVDATFVVLTLPSSESVRAIVFDVLGRVVTTVHDGPLAAGRHELRAPLPTPGHYLVRVQAGRHLVARSVTVSR